jgi:hypothetical protein
MRHTEGGLHNGVAFVVRGQLRSKGAKSARKTSVLENGRVDGTPEVCPHSTANGFSGLRLLTDLLNVSKKMT